MGKYQALGYMPTHKQHSLDPSLTVEQITERLGVQPSKADPGNDYDEGGDKVSYQWEFFAQEGFVGDPIPCSIWDYKGSRWSAFGPREVFEDLGLAVVGSY